MMKISVIVFCLVGITLSKIVQLKNFTLNIEKGLQTGDLLSGSRTRNIPYTPTGTYFKGSLMTPLDDYVSRPDPTYT